MARETKVSDQVFYLRVAIELNPPNCPPRSRKRGPQILSKSFIFFLLNLSVAQAAIHFVQPGHSVVAVAATAANGDTVLLEDGIHHATVVLEGRFLTFASRFLLDQDTIHASSTIIRPDSQLVDTFGVFVCSQSNLPPTRIVGLTLEAGQGTHSERADSRMGGAILVAGARMEISECVFRSCVAGYGGAIAADGVSYPEFSTNLNMNSVRILHCRSIDIGAGLYASDAQLQVNDSRFMENRSFGFAGGAYVAASDADITNTVFHRNDAMYTGGLRWANSVGEIRVCDFDSNGFSADFLASHLNCSGPGALITGCRFGATPSGCIGVMLYAGDNDSLSEVRGNMFEGIITTQITGCLGLFSGQGDVSYNIFRNNVNINGGAIYVADGVFARVHHNVFENNSSTIAEAGSILQIAGTNTVLIDSNWISGNRGTTMTCSITPQGCVNPIYAQRNWWGHESGPFHATLNPDGQGDTLTGDMVQFIPWLTSPPDTSQPNDISTERSAVSSTWKLLSLYPNPFNNDFRLEIAGFTRGDFSLSLYDLLGREISVLHRGALTGGSIHFTAPPSLSSGVYFVKASDSEFTDTKKVVLLK